MRCAASIPSPSKPSRSIQTDSPTSPESIQPIRTSKNWWRGFPGRSHLLEPALEKFPGLQLILDHCGVSRTEGEHAAQLDRVFALARYPNLALNELTDLEKEWILGRSARTILRWPSAQSGS